MLAVEPGGEAVQSQGSVAQVVQKLVGRAADRADRAPKRAQPGDWHMAGQASRVERSRLWPITLPFARMAASWADLFDPSLLTHARWLLAAVDESPGWARTLTQRPNWPGGQREHSVYTNRLMDVAKPSLRRLATTEEIRSASGVWRRGHHSRIQDWGGRIDDARRCYKTAARSNTKPGRSGSALMVTGASKLCTASPGR